MPLRMIDWRCAACGYQWEELTNTTSIGSAPRPTCRQCRRALADRVITAPAIRTNDNMPREFRTLTTAGHPAEGTNIKGRDVISSQLGVEITSREQHDRIVRERGLEMVSAAEYSNKYLSYEPPPPRLEDDPVLFRESVDEFADMYDRAEAGALPEISTPMMDQDAEAREVIDQMTRSGEAVESVDNG